MAQIYKNFLNDDVVTTRSLLNESIPITGSIVSGTYSDLNIKTYTHGQFQSIYDYPYLSSSANHIFDLTLGISPRSALSSSSTNQNAKKINIYNQMAQVLVGHDMTGSILEFDQDGDIIAGGNKIREAYFISFARLLNKDEIKKQSFTIQLGTGSSNATPMTNLLTIGDYGAQSDFRVNSPAGEYGVLYTSSVNITPGTGVGLLYYQAGIAVLTASLFDNAVLTSTNDTRNAAITGSTIDTNMNGFRRRWYNCSFNNTTELNSTIYFCRVNHNDFNYSSNPTYLSGSKIRVKNSSLDQPVTYITTVNLHGSDGSVLGCAKLSEPLRKDPTQELIIRVRTDY